jgi:hypothetical protein
MIIALVSRRELGLVPRLLLLLLLRKVAMMVVDKPTLVIRISTAVPAPVAIDFFQCLLLDPQTLEMLLVTLLPLLALLLLLLVQGGQRCGWKLCA